MSFNTLSSLRIEPPVRLTAARWSSIRPPCTRMISEKKSSSGTVAPMFECGARAEAPLADGLRSAVSTSMVALGRGSSSERWSSRRAFCVRDAQKVC